MTKTIIINGEIYEIGVSKCITLGFNMKCKYCMCTNSKLSVEDGEIIDSNGGIRMLVHDVNDYYLDTPENRKKLRSVINQKNTH